MRFLHSVITRASVGTAAIQNGSAMTQLDHALYRAIRIITGFSPEIYELVLMVDADTVMEKDALRYMVLVMSNDERVMGLCGETRIANKDESWITKIQVSFVFLFFVFVLYEGRCSSSLSCYFHIKSIYCFRLGCVVVRL
jgi:cellulose synthase/poly-beta-1,6-N-acetylglucosamine synthase-like glycosyltransferase